MNVHADALLMFICERLLRVSSNIACFCYYFIIHQIDLFTDSDLIDEDEIAEGIS